MTQSFWLCLLDFNRYLGLCDFHSNFRQALPELLKKWVLSALFQEAATYTHHGISRYLLRVIYMAHSVSEASIQTQYRSL